MPGGILFTVVAERCRGQQFSVLESLLERPVHGFAFLDGLLLCKRGEEGEHELRILAQRIEVVGFKEHPDRRRQAFQHPDQGNAVHQISRKSGNALREDEVVFALFAGFDHRVELIPVLEGCPGDALIGKDVFELPIRMVLNQLAVVCLLKLERGKLLIVIGRDTAIRANPKEAIPFIWIDLRLCRNECLFACVLPLIDLTQLLSVAVILHRFPPLCS